MIKKEKLVPVLKPENFGEQMSGDEKMIDEEFYTVMTNRETGKIASKKATLITGDKEFESVVGEVNFKVKYL